MATKKKSSKKIEEAPAVTQTDLDSAKGEIESLTKERLDLNYENNELSVENGKLVAKVENLRSNIEVLKAGAPMASGQDVISLGDMMGQIHSRIGKIHDPAKSAEHGQIMRLIESDLSVWITDGRIQCLVDRKTSHSFFTVTDAKEFVNGAVVRRT